MAAATALAFDVERLTEIRRTLRQTMLTSYLCDGKSFTMNLEVTYRQLWQRYCRKEQGAKEGQQQVLISKKHKNKEPNNSRNKKKKNKNEEGKENGDGNVCALQDCLEPRGGNVNNVNIGSIGLYNPTDEQHSSIVKKETMKGRIKLKGRDIHKKSKQKKVAKAVPSEATLTALLSPPSKKADGKLVEPSSTEEATTTKDMLSLATSLPDNSHNRQQSSRSSPIPIPKKGQRPSRYTPRLSSSSSSTQTLSPEPTPPNSPSLPPSSSSSPSTVAGLTQTFSN